MKWPIVTLKDVAIIDWGNTNLTKSSYTNSGQYIGVSATGPDGRMDHFEHEAGVTVISAIGANCGRVFFLNEKFTAIKNTMTVTPKREKVLPRYLYLLLSRNSIPKRGGGQPFISKGDAEKYRIALPPLDIQREIVAVLDKSGDIKRKREEASQKMAAFAPALFYQMFGDPAKNEKGWEMRKLSSFAEFDKRTYDADTNLPYVGLEDIESGTGRLKRLHENAEIKSKVFRFNGNQILYAKLRPNLNKVILSNSSGQCSTELVPILTKAFVTREWLFQILISNWFVQQAVKSIKGANLPRADLKTLSNLEIAVPPIELQEQFSDIILTAQSIVKNQNICGKKLEESFNSTLNAFMA